MQTTLTSLVHFGVVKLLPLSDADSTASATELFLGMFRLDVCVLLLRKSAPRSLGVFSGIIGVQQRGAEFGLRILPPSLEPLSHKSRQAHGRPRKGPSKARRACHYTFAETLGETTLPVWQSS